MQRTLLCLAWLVPLGRFPRLLVADRTSFVLQGITPLPSEAQAAFLALLDSLMLCWANLCAAPAAAVRSHRAWLRLVLSSA